MASGPALLEGCHHDTDLCLEIPFDVEHAEAYCRIRCGVYLLIADIVPNHVNVGECQALRSMLAMDSCSEIASLLNAD